MNKIKNFLYLVGLIILGIVTLGIIGTEIVFNLIHPEYTRMMMFYKFWWLDLILFGVWIIPIYLLGRK